MLRARILSAREAGREETRELLAETAVASGIDLAGYRLGADFFRHFEAMAPNARATVIAQDAVGGSGLWLRAEPGEDSAQAGGSRRRRPERSAEHTSEAPHLITNEYATVCGI